MKRLDMQKLALSKFQGGDGPNKIFHVLNRTIGLSIVKRWCKMITGTGSMSFCKLPWRPRSVRTKTSIKNVKQQLQRKKKYSIRKLSKKLGFSRTSVQRILKNDLKCYPYKKLQNLLSLTHTKQNHFFLNLV